MSEISAAYFGQSLISSPRPLIPVRAAMNLNEMPADLPTELKDRILAAFSHIELNRYPEPHAASLALELAAWYGCRADQIMVGPGSSAFIRLLLTFFGLQCRGRLVITRPSFAYYEQFCRAYHIQYDTWELDDRFQYDLVALGDLPDFSVVFLTTPNNPTGNVLATSELQLLLQQHPRSLFIVDEAYAEFINESMVPLLEYHDNLVILKTFSKAFSTAGLRCGSLIASPDLIRGFTTLQTPWQLTPFTIEAAKVALEYVKGSHWVQDQLTSIITARDTLWRSCVEAGYEHFIVYPSAANFLLFQGKTEQAYLALAQACQKNGILVQDLHREPRLEHCVRVSLASSDENQLFLEVFRAVIQNCRHNGGTVQ